MSKIKAKTISAFEFLNIFDTQEKCIKFLEELRWNNNITCVHCSYDGKMYRDRKDYQCKSCNKRFNVKTKQHYKVQCYH